MTDIEASTRLLSIVGLIESIRPASIIPLVGISPLEKVGSAMATDGYWADPVIERDRVRVYSPTLDSMIGADDAVRLVDEVLSQVDWSSWEAEYERKRGQPPIHPRYIAGALLYGMYRGIRSTRRLEEACHYRFDFQWLVQGHRIDHTTFSRFRTKFKGPLKGLFRQIGRIAITLGLITFCEVAFDGTRTKANNSRYKTRTAKTLEEKLRDLDAKFDEILAKCEETDTNESGLGSPVQLPEELADLEERRAKIASALEKAKAADELRRQQGVNPQKNPAQIPTTDPDSKVMPNKEGGYAPNYTPVATTDGHKGFIVDVDVLSEVNESSALAPSVDRIEGNFGQKPEKMLTDAGNNSGQVMQEMEDRNVEFYAPAEFTQPQPGDPAFREDPTQPVPESQWSDLKRNSQGQIDKTNFIYVQENDEYRCPQGKPMPFEKTKPVQIGGVRVQRRIYRRGSCAGCPLAEQCLSRQSKHGRTITRDPYEEARERTATRMATPEARALYNQRPRIAETTFGITKNVMGVRQFLLRGLEKVKIEWTWAATAFNMMKLVREIGEMRAESAEFAL